MTAKEWVAKMRSVPVKREDGCEMECVGMLRDLAAEEKSHRIDLDALAESERLRDAAEERAEKVQAECLRALRMLHEATAERERLREELRKIPDGMRTCPECEGRGYVEDWDTSAGSKERKGRE